MCLVTQHGADLIYRDRHGNELAYAAWSAEMQLYCFSIDQHVQDVTGMCFPPMSAKACTLAADLLQQMMADAGY